MTENQSIFKNESAKKAYFAAYDRTLESWPVAYKSKYISTSFGATHVLVSGRVKGKPIVLMPGKGGTATNWIENVAALSAKHCVYAVDILGDLGKSTIIKKYSNRSEFADWLTQVLDGLAIQKTDMVGVSVGSYLIVNYALEKPNRLHKIVLLAPGATFSSFSISLMVKGSIANIFGIEFLIKRIFRTMINDDKFFEKDVWKQNILGMKSEKIGKEKPFLLPLRLSDEDLKNISVPTLMAVGENENFNRDSPSVVIERARKLVPNIKTIIVPGGYHSLNLSSPEQVNSIILEFLSE